MKHIHRLIVTSNTYRMSSNVGRIANPSYRIDSNNRYLWRMNSRRMEAEAVRDSVLAVAGNLDSAMGGPDLDEKLGQSSRRRSLYFRTTPDNKMEMLEVFDLANPNECYRRRESVVPQQALALTNSAIALDQGRLLARELTSCIGDSTEPETVNRFITAAFERILSRTPKLDELAACRRFLNTNASLLRDSSKLVAFPAGGQNQVPPAAEPDLRARENLVHVLFSHNDFVTIR